MSTNERLYTLNEVRSMNQELNHEISTLYHIRDQQSSDISQRDEEISKILLEKTLMEEERDLLKTQVEIITRKAIESLEFQTAMFSLCENLQ